MFECAKRQTVSLDTGLLSKVCPTFAKPSTWLKGFDLDKKVLSEDEKKTQEYDALAFRLVSYAALPMLAGYTVYSRESADRNSPHSADELVPRSPIRVRFQPETAPTAD